VSLVKYRTLFDGGDSGLGQDVDWSAGSSYAALLSFVDSGVSITSTISQTPS